MHQIVLKKISILTILVLSLSAKFGHCDPAKNNLAEDRMFESFAQTMAKEPLAVMVCPFEMVFEKDGPRYYRVAIRCTVISSLKGNKKRGEVLEISRRIETRVKPKSQLGELKIIFYEGSDGGILISNGSYIPFSEKLWEYLKGALDLKKE